MHPAQKALYRAAYEPLGALICAKLEYEEIRRQPLDKQPLFVSLDSGRLRVS